MVYRLWSEQSNNDCLPRIQKLFGPQDWTSQLVFSVRWNPEEVDSTASEEMYWQPMRANKQGKKSFFLVFYIGCQHRVLPRFRVGLLPSDDLNLICLPIITTNEPIKKNLPQVYPAAYLSLLLLFMLNIWDGLLHFKVNI